MTSFMLICDRINMIYGCTQLGIVVESYESPWNLLLLWLRLLFSRLLILLLLRLLVVVVVGCRGHIFGHVFSSSLFYEDFPKKILPSDVDQLFDRSLQESCILTPTALSRV
ncbi:hypothetical protein PanWU01x14_151010 [Parasponia andersonii]|uniref:Uncharacterized protein n=1 Tax=Parasponia andersonii TaxID=3476 RepID=A0A2P5CI26_PARAD|nr:hypothetical protein PanWU01x14_151010 [Parasponia andersonii]